MSSFKRINSLGEIQSIKTKLIAVIAGASVATALCLGGCFTFERCEEYIIILLLLINSKKEYY